MSTLGCVILVPFDQQHVNCVGNTRGDWAYVALTLKKMEGLEAVIIR
jgi:hypothetical protein